jgi:proton glutamate symport protein
MLAILLIVASLIKGVSDMQDLGRLSTLGGRTVALFLGTTMASVEIGLVPGALSTSRCHAHALSRWA